MVPKNPEELEIFGKYQVLVTSGRSHFGGFPTSQVLNLHRWPAFCHAEMLIARQVAD